MPEGDGCDVYAQSERVKSDVSKDDIQKIEELAAAGLTG
jgi:hypothetical protein